MKKYTTPKVIDNYSAVDLKKFILAEACSAYSVSCGCYGGGHKLR